MNSLSRLESFNWTREVLETDTPSRHPILYGIAIYALFLIIVGTIGNILTIIILLRPNLRKYATMRYLTAAAVADLCALYSWNLNLFYKHLINRYQNDVEDFSMISCRIVSFIAFSSLQLSSWYLTLVSLDRCLNIHFLFWHRKVERSNCTTYIIISMTLIIAILNSHLFFFNGFYEKNCKPLGKRTCFTCYAHPKDLYYIFPKWERIHMFIYNFIPFTIMLISNCFIIRRSVPSDIQRTSSSKLNRNASRKYRQRKQKQLTYCLLIITFLFVLLTTPIMIYNVFLRNRLRERRLFKYILQGILLCMQYTSHAINFFIYCYGASNFRHELNNFVRNCFNKTQNT